MRACMPLVMAPNRGVFEFLVEPNADGTVYLEWLRSGYQVPSGSE
jgi:hypothetical protein